MWNYGKLSAKFLVSRVKDINTVGFLSGFFSSFTRTTIKIPLKFTDFTFNKSKGWSISASNTKAHSADLIIRGSLNFCNTSGEITRNLQNFKNFQKPPPGKKNDTSLKEKIFSAKQREIF